MTDPTTVWSGPSHKVQQLLLAAEKAVERLTEIEKRLNARLQILHSTTTVIAGIKQRHAADAAPCRTIGQAIQIAVVAELVEGVIQRLLSRPTVSTEGENT